MVIYVIYIENEEIEVEEERVTPPPPEDPPAGNCFYFDICGAEPDSPITQGKPPVHLPPPCYFKIFLTCLMH
jgi:hypothetical protein